MTTALVVPRRALWVGEQRYGQPVLCRPVPMGLDALTGDPDDGRLQRIEALSLVPVGAELACAHGGVVTGVEEEHHAIATMLGEAEGAGGAVERELGCGIADLGRGHAERISGAPIEVVK